MALTITQHYFTKFYLAALLRAPELGGLNYWANEVQSGKSLHEVGGIIFSLPTVTDIYPANLTDTDFVEAIYHNVFGRNSDAEGLNYWANEIATLRSNFAAQGSTNAAYEARGQLVINIINAGLGTAEGTDGKAYIENRLAVAAYVAEQQIAQSRDISVTFLQETLSQVNANDASVITAQDAIAHLLEDKTAPNLVSLEATTSALHSGKLSTDPFSIFSLLPLADGKRLHDNFGEVLQLADGKLLLAGISSDDNSGGNSGGSFNFALARYNADGSLDSSFGDGDGKVTTDFAGDSDWGYSLIQQTDGKLVLAGDASEGGNDNFALARYNLDGSLDTSFGGGDGKVTTDFGGDYDRGKSLIQQADGKLVLAGYAVEGANSNFALARYNLDGTLDTTFGGGDGKVTTDFAGSFGSIDSLIQQADGKLVVAGLTTTVDDRTQHFALARYNLDGTLDTSFGGKGKFITFVREGTFEWSNLIQQSDGKLVLITDGFVSRYNLDGSLDTAFGDDRLSALSLSTSENATAGLYDSSNALIGLNLSLSANVAATLEVSAQASVTQTSLRMTDIAGNSSTGAAVALGTERGDTISLGSAGYLFGFDGDDALTGSSGADIFIGGSGYDTLNLGSDSAVDRVLFDDNSMGYSRDYDTINGLVLGTGGDVLDVTALNLGSLSFNASVFSAPPPDSDQTTTSADRWCACWTLVATI